MPKFKAGDKVKCIRHEYYEGVGTLLNDQPLFVIGREYTVLGTQPYTIWRGGESSSEWLIQLNLDAHHTATTWWAAEVLFAPLEDAECHCEECQKGTTT